MTARNRIKLKSRADTRLFKLGEPFHSLDGGKSWTRGYPPGQPPGPCLVVTKIDHQRGVVTIGVG